MDSESLAHTKWNCKYHIVFAPKYRRQIIYGRLRTEIGKILRELCKRKEIEILEAEACPDHIHMLLSIPPKYSVSSVMGYLKGKSSLMIFDRFANLKYKYGNREFWCRGYYVDTVGRNKAAIEKYIRNQLIEDKNEEQLVMKELFDPFTGEPAKKVRLAVCFRARISACRYYALIGLGQTTGWAGGHDFQLMIHPNHCIHSLRAERGRGSIEKTISNMFSCIIPHALYWKNG